MSEQNNELASETFRLFETIRLENGEYALLDHHVKRLANSASQLDFSISIDKIQELLEDHRGKHLNEIQRIRLFLAKNGEAALDAGPLPVLTDSPQPVLVAKSPVNSDDWLLYYKTTNRNIYEKRRPARNDYFDVLLQNEKHQLTEFTIGNLVLEREGALLTPPLECGLLPGTMRASLLEEGKIQEEIVTYKDLHRATHVWLINSLRGWVPVYLKE